MQGSKVKLPSRYRDVETIYHQIDDNCGIITSNGNYVRCILSKDEKSIESIDFEGGPMIGIGDTLCDKKIKSIKSVYYVELE